MCVFYYLKQEEEMTLNVLAAILIQSYAFPHTRFPSPLPFQNIPFLSFQRGLSGYWRCCERYASKQSLNMFNQHAPIEKLTWFSTSLGTKSWLQLEFHWHALFSNSLHSSMLSSSHLIPRKVCLINSPFLDSTTNNITILLFFWMIY